MNHYPTIINNSENRLSHKLRLDWPYDWSNPHMSEVSFIRAVLQQGRFEDTLKVSAYFGIDRIEYELMWMSKDDYGSHAITKAHEIPSRIRAGHNQSQRTGNASS